MLVSDLIKTLEPFADKEVHIGYTETVELSEVTSSDEDRLTEANGIYQVEDKVIIGTDSYHSFGGRIWPIW